MLETILFIIAIIDGYVIPWIAFKHEYQGWIGVIIIYMIDMVISRIRWPEEMNTPEITDSEKMTYAGAGSAFILGILSFFGIISGIIWFIGYMVIGGLIYFVWRKLTK